MRGEDADENHLTSNRAPVLCFKGMPVSLEELRYRYIADPATYSERRPTEDYAVGALVGGFTRVSWLSSTGATLRRSCLVTAPTATRLPNSQSNGTTPSTRCTTAPGADHPSVAAT